MILIQNNNNNNKNNNNNNDDDGGGKVDHNDYIGARSAIVSLY